MKTLLNITNTVTTDLVLDIIMLDTVDTLWTLDTDTNK
jgi:hypothetical protein